MLCYEYCDAFNFYLNKKLVLNYDCILIIIIPWIKRNMQFYLNFFTFTLILQKLH
jgi:hypothetical protein